MHELSIAESLLKQVQHHTPPGGKVRRVMLRVGPMRGIEPEAMRMGWEAVTRGTACQQAELCAEYLRWQLLCPLCQRTWASDELYVSCSCGCSTPHPMGGDELDLMSMEVDVDETSDDATKSRRAGNEGVEEQTSGAGTVASQREKP